MTVKGVPVRFMMRFAFSVRDFRIAGGPSWMNTDTYDIDAKASENVNLQQIRLYPQKLLEDRFRLVVHREKKQVPTLRFACRKKRAENCAFNGRKLRDARSEKSAQTRITWPALEIHFLVTPFHNPYPKLRDNPGETTLPGSRHAPIERTPENDPDAGSHIKDPAMLSPAPDSLSFGARSRKDAREAVVSFVTRIFVQRRVGYPQRD